MHANFWLVLWDVAWLAVLVLAVRSLVALRFDSPYTFAGWLFTAGYCVLAIAVASMHRKAPFGSDYALVAALTVAFVVAGFRREPQAEPWWWPKRSSFPT